MQAVPSLFSGDDAFTLAPRVELRSGFVACIAVLPRHRVAHAAEAFALMADARRLLQRQGRRASVSIAMPLDLLEDLDALDSAAQAHALPMQEVVLEIAEADLIAGGAAAMADVEDLRARGWRLALRGAPACPIAFSARVRALFCELLVDAPPSAFADLDEADDSPLPRRLRAARAAGIVLTCIAAPAPDRDRKALACGFDRAERAFAETRLAH